MSFAVTYIRYLIIYLAIAAAIGIFVFVQFTEPIAVARSITLSELYGLIAIWLIYFALLVTPLTQAWPTIPVPVRVLYMKARRAIGFSAFIFAILHATVSFFYLMGGFQGLLFLSGKYLIAIILSFTALIILTAMAATSFDTMVRVLGPRWKQLHRLVYIAAIFVLIHAMLLGTDLNDIHHPIAQIFYIAVVFLLALEALRIYRFLIKKYTVFSPRLFLAAMFIIWARISLYLYSVLDKGAHFH